MPDAKAAPPLLVFDLDGTLVDTAPDLLATLDAVLVGHGFGPAPHDLIRPGIGRGSRFMLAEALKAQGAPVEEAVLAAMHADYLAHYEAHIADASRPYPGVAALLDRFGAAGWRFAVCTTKFEGLSRLLLRALGLDHRLSAIGGADSFGARKPDPRHLTETVRAAGGARERAILVGDSATDVNTARAADIPFIGVSFGYTPVPMARLAPDLLIDDFDELTVAAAGRLIAAPRKAPESRALDFAQGPNLWSAPLAGRAGA